MFAERLAFCLAHSIWQASVIAILTAGVLRSVPVRAAGTRYLVAAASLSAMLLAAIATFFFYDSDSYGQTAALSISFQAIATSAVFTHWTQSIVLLWLAGVTVCSTRLAIAWILARRLLQAADGSIPPAVIAAFARLKERIGVSRPVRLLQSTNISVPVTMGWLRPAVLLPAAVITGLDPEYLHAVLAHEIAHIRRHDFMVNLLQGIVESLMFYHPAVWWISSRLRIEREHCCDDLAIGVCRDRAVYVRALLELEQARAHEPALMLAANGGSLRARICRILGRETAHSDHSDWLPAAAGSLLAAMWLLFGLWQSNPLLAQTASPFPAPSAATDIQSPPPNTDSPSAQPSILQLALTTFSRPAARLPIASSSSSSTQQSSGTIEGYVVKAGAGDPLAGATVMLKGGAASPPVISGDDGKFSFHNLAAGDYHVIANYPGGAYTASEYGQQSPKGHPMTVTLIAAQTVSSIRLEMWPTGSISGRVFDGDGDPIGNARVLALQPVYKDGHKSFSIVQAVPTNDAGEYRLFWLPPAHYYIEVKLKDPRTAAFSTFIAAPGATEGREDASSPVINRRTIESIAPNGLRVVETLEETDIPIFYGGGTDIRKAQAIDLTSGTNVGAIDIPAGAAIVGAHHVRGIAIDGSNGQPAAGALVRLIPESPSGPHVVIPNATADKKGLFDIAGATPGRYILFSTVNAGRGGGPTETFVDVSKGMSGRVVIDIAEHDIDNISVTVKSPFTISGQVLFEGGLPSRNNIHIALSRDPSVIGMPNTMPVMGNARLQPNGAPAADETFSLTGFGPGDYHVNVTSLPPNSYVKAIRMGALELLTNSLHLESQPDRTLEVVIGMDAGSIEGSVMTDKLDPVVNAVIALVPDGPLRSLPFLYKSGASLNSGRFQLRGIAPGDYKVFAWTDIDPDSWQDPDVLRLYEFRGTPIHVTAGSSNEVDLTVIPKGQ